MSLVSGNFGSDLAIMVEKREREGSMTLKRLQWRYSVVYSLISMETEEDSTLAKSQKDCVYYFER